MAKYSVFKASKNSLIGAIFASVPTIISYLVTSHYLDTAAANAITSIVGVFAVAFGVEAVTFKNRLK